MKFKLQHFHKLHGRLGSLSDVERLPAFTLDTPNIFFYTRGGCIPHLTYDVLQKVTTDIISMQYPLSSSYRISEAVKKSNNSLHSFVGFSEYLSYCFTQDPLYMFPEGKHKEASATIRTIGGSRNIICSEYMELMECFQPDLYVTLNDCDTSPSSSTKRLCNAVHFTNYAFSLCYKAHTSSSVLKNKGLIAPVAGGYDLTLRERCAKYLSDFPVLGYLIDGLFSNGLRVHEVPIESAINIISHTLNFLPDERLRIIHGAWDPHAVLQMVKTGVDIFDSSFPTLNAEHGRALVFNFDVPNLLDDNVKLFINAEENDLKKQITVENGESDSFNRAGSCDYKKKPKFPKFMRDSQTDIKCDNQFSISLTDTKYFDDFTPLMENCACLTCRKHTKAYLHHLLCSSEMLAPVLLTIHNLHHYIEFFRRIREHLHKQFE